MNHIAIMRKSWGLAEKILTGEKKVQKVLQFSGLTPKKVKKLLEIYGKDNGIEKENGKDFFWEI